MVIFLSVYIFVSGNCILEVKDPLILSCVPLSIELCSKIGLFGFPSIAFRKASLIPDGSC